MTENNFWYNVNISNVAMQGKFENDWTNVLWDIASWSWRFFIINQFPWKIVKEICLGLHKPPTSRGHFSKPVCPIVLNYSLYHYIAFIYLTSKVFGHDPGPLMIIRNHCYKSLVDIYCFAVIIAFNFLYTAAVKLLTLCLACMHASSLLFSTYNGK